MVRLLAYERREELPASSHIAEIYARAEETVEIAAGLFSADPFPHRDRCLYLGPAASWERIADRLTSLGVDVPRLVDAGQVRVVCERDALLNEGRFDPFMLLGDHLGSINEARRDGFAGVRLAIDMLWLLGPQPDPATLLKYEAMCDSVFTFHRQPIVAIAQYRATSIGEQVAADLVKLHPILYVGRYLKRNPGYHPSGPAAGGPDGPGPSAPAASMPRPRRPLPGDAASA